MRSFRSPQFKKLLDALPPEIQHEALEAYRLWRLDPNHPGLHFKQLKGHQRYWSVRVGRGYRAVGERDGDLILWFWVGTRQEFGKLF